MPDGKGGYRAARRQNPAYLRQREGLTGLLGYHPDKPGSPIEHPVIVRLCIIYPYRKSEPKRNRGGLIPKITRPDIDNVTKLYLDALQSSGWIKDDSIISHLDVSRRWGPEPGIGMEIGMDGGQFTIARDINAGSDDAPPPMDAAPDRRMDTCSCLPDRSERPCESAPRLW